MLKEGTFLTVSQLNGCLKALLESVPDLKRITVKGEISNWKRYPTAAYFDLKDEKSVVPCIMWRDGLDCMPFEPKDGDEVLATGAIRVYEARGRYQLYVGEMSLFGQGAELLRLEALKKKLQAEGLFDESRKRPLPEFPSAIGLIVGKDSAAEADLIKNLQRRWPLSDLVVFPSLVQGAGAPKDILRAFALSKSYPLSVLIFARGGGSSEDLGAFNDEALVRAVAGSVIPTISAVGHEVDFTLLDYVVDKRVSTPTAAAEAATPDILDIRQNIDECTISLDESINRTIDGYKEEVDGLATRPFFKAPESMYERASEDVADLGKRMALALSNAFGLRRAEIVRYGERLQALNPYGVLKRGYAISQKEDGTVVKSVRDVKSGDMVKTQVEDGIITSKVV